MHAICNPHHVVAYPALSNSDLMDVMKRCLDRDPKSRISLQVRTTHAARPKKTPHACRQGCHAAADENLRPLVLLLLLARRLQELLAHAFLHPHRRQAAAPAPAALGLSEEQMKQLVAQVQWGQQRLQHSMQPADSVAAASMQTGRCH